MLLGGSLHGKKVYKKLSLTPSSSSSSLPSGNDGLNQEKVWRELVEERNRRKKKLAVAEIALANMERELSRQEDDSSDDGSRTSVKNTPPSALKLGITNFNSELKALLFNAGRRFEDRISRKDFSDEAKRNLTTLELSNQGVWDRENQRPPIRAPLIIKIPYYFLCVLLDTLFEDDPLG